MGEDALALAHQAVTILEDKGGEHILLLDLMGICSFADFFIICSGRSEPTVRALAEEVARKLKGKRRINVEGDASSGWVLLDLGDIIIHLFSPKLRSYYRLEDLWHEGRVVVHMR
jgi:ribosome-associated protein